MLNRYQSNPAEFKRMVDIVEAGMTVAEIEDVLNHNIYAFAKALNVPHHRTRSTLSRNIYNRLKLVDPTKPHIPLSDLPRTIACDGCRDIADVEGLRWEKMNRGEALTWSIDRTNQPNNSAAFSDTEIHRWFLAWTTITGNRVVQLKNGEIGDCHIKFQRIDGPGKVMGFVWQPRVTMEMMMGGNLSGDMIIDSSERSYPLLRTRRFGKHEAGHVFGLQHDRENLNALMYHLLLADTDLNPQAPDVLQWKMRYIDQRTIPHA